VEADEIADVLLVLDHQNGAFDPHGHEPETVYHPRDPGMKSE
jgi:hypothetical protein